MAINRTNIHHSAMLKPQVAKRHKHVYNEIDKTGKQICSECADPKEKG